MSDEAFADLKEAMEDALAFERGQLCDLKVTRIQAPRPPKAKFWTWRVLIPRRFQLRSVRYTKWLLSAVIRFQDRR